MGQNSNNRSLRLPKSPSAVRKNVRRADIDSGKCQRVMYNCNVMIIQDI